MKKNNPVIEICIDCPYKKHPCPEGCSKIVTQTTTTKYFKRGQREFYQVTPERVIRLVNKQYRSDVTIFFHAVATVTEDAMEGVEINRDQFAEQFKMAANLIVLDP